MSALRNEQEAGKLQDMLAAASARSLMPGAYGGEVTPQEAWEFLCSEEGMLVDVRTQAEWQLVGVPDLRDAQGKLLTISWKLSPAFTLNPQFSEQLRASASAETPLFFLCRSGGRSLDAAIAMQAEGFRYCFNVSDGFEGEPDAQGQRGKMRGWKAAQLPWRQA